MSPAPVGLGGTQLMNNAQALAVPAMGAPPVPSFGPPPASMSYRPGASPSYPSVPPGSPAKPGVVYVIIGLSVVIAILVIVLLWALFARGG